MQRPILQYCNPFFRLTFDRFTTSQLSSITILTKNFIVSDDNLATLINGFNFVPKCKYVNKKLILSQIDDFIRRVQWRSILGPVSDDCRFGIHKSEAYPSIKSLSKRILKWSKEIRCGTKRLLFRNDERFPQDDTKLLQSVENIKSMENIIIKKADKGSSWCILNKNLYENEVARLLSDTNTYSQVTRPKFLYLYHRIKMIVDVLRKKRYINTNEKLFLMENERGRSRKFYLLPKIHKNEWIIPAILPPGRPIITDTKSVSQNFSKYIDYFLQKITQHLPTYLQNSEDLKVEIDNISLPKNCLIFTLDVKDLYTSLPLEKIIKLTKIYFQLFPDNSRPDSYIYALLPHLLYNNEFIHNQTCYTQNHGISMGRAFSPSFANMYMFYWESKLLLSSNDKPLFWRRYIDDIFGIWAGDENSLIKFVEFANNLDPFIKLTLKYSFHEISFLDMLIKKSSDNNQLKTSVYFKPTETFTILNKGSNHPKHIFGGIVTSQILRWIRLCSNKDDFDRICRFVFSRWKNHGYTHSFLSNIRASVVKNLNLQEWNFGFHKCFNCSVCQYAVETTQFYNVQTNKLFRIIGSFDCRTKNTIYVVNCKKCSKKYVGQTSRETHNRMTAHIRSIYSDIKCPVGDHFKVCRVENFQFLVLYKINNTNKRLLKELHWIKRLKSREPLGLNNNENMSNFPIHCALPFHKKCFPILSFIKSKCNEYQINMQTCYKRNRNLTEML